MKLLVRIGVLALVALLVYWFSAPYARVQVQADPYETQLVNQVWKTHPPSLLLFLNSGFIAGRLEGLPVSSVIVRRERPWNATIDIDIDTPDLVVVQGKQEAAVFLGLTRAYMITKSPDTWKVMEVRGFPSASSAFLSACLEYAPLLRELESHQDQLVVSSASLSPSTGLAVKLKDGKTLIFGDGSAAESKVERGLAVAGMPSFKSKKITIDLRFDGQAVIPENP
ncbi:MAG: cell division protein FtsQ/DivIB [Candidatus Cryosericum sp.]